MRTLDIFRRAGKNLNQAKTRTVLTSLAIGVGAFTIALAMAAGQGGRAYTEEMVSSSGDMHSLSVYPRPEQPIVTDVLPKYGAEDEAEAAASDGGGMTGADIDKFEALDGVEQVLPMLHVEGEYVTRGEGHDKRIAPLSVKVDRTRVELAAGSLTDGMLKKGEAMIPEGFLSVLGFDDAQSAIGQSIYIGVGQFGATEPQSKEFRLTIVAVDRPSDTTIYYNESVQISPDDSRTMYKYQYGDEASDKYYGVTVLVERHASVTDLQQQIGDMGYEVFGLEDVREALLQVIAIAQWGLAGFGALAIMASIFGIINTQYISVLERTQQIGLMKALGMRSRDISKLFRYEAAWIGMLGGVIGVGLAWSVTLLNPLISDLLELEEGTRMLVTDWLANVALVIVLMIVAVLSGYFPARKAAKLDPIEALRSE